MSTKRRSMEWITAQGHRLEARWIDGDAKTRLVFLHEGLGSAELWRDFPLALCEATGCPGLVYSRLGYGRSDPVALPRPLSFMHDEARGALAEILERERIDDAILVGHSDGASIAIIYAGEIGKRVRGLALEAPHVFVEPVCVASIARMREDYARTDLRDRLARRHADVDGAFHGWADTWLHPDFLRWDLTGLLPAIRVPVLVVQGDRDEYGTLAQVDAICAQVGGPSERLILSGVGHSPHRERPEETLAAMARFIRRLLSRGALRA